MAYPTRPSYLTNYFDLKQAAADANRKKYRSIPVPVTAVENADHIDNRLKLEMLTDHLATRDQFTSSVRIDDATFNSMSTADQLATIKKLSEEVNAAPDIQKDNARKGFVSHLGTASKFLGGSLWHGIKTRFHPARELFLSSPLSHGIGLQAQQAYKGFETPVIQAGMNYAQVGSWEVTGQFLLGAQSFIPGEQTLERNARLRREQHWGKDLPWWRRNYMMDSAQFMTPVTQEHGFGVPAGVHIPLEVALDPLNYIGIGWLKWGKIGIKEGARITGLSNNTFVANLLKEGWEQLPESSSVLRSIGSGNIESLFPEFTAAERTAALRFLRRHSLTHLTEEEAVKLVDGIRISRRNAQFPYPAGTIPGGGSGTAHDGSRWGDRLDADFDEVVMPENFEQQPNVRADPNFDKAGSSSMSDPSTSAPSKLFEMANDKDLNPLARWALLAMYHYGVRPDELAMIKLDDLLMEVQKTEGLPDVPMTVGTGKANNRRMTPEAVKFTRRWLGVAKTGEVPISQDPLYAGLKPRSELIQGSPQRNIETSAFFMLDDVNSGGFAAATSKLINRALAEVATRYGQDGEWILSFYEGNGNFSYVFRLALANRMFRNSMGVARNIRPTMQALGHNSPFHTSRYVSSSNLIHQDLRSFFRASGLNPNLIDEAIRELELKVPGDRFLAKRYPNRAKSDLSGEGRAQAIRDIDTARFEFLKQALAKTSDTVGLVAENTEPEVAEAIGLLEELLVFATAVDNMRFEKALIHVTDTSKAGEAIHAGVAEAREAAEILRNWMKPILDLSQQQVAIVEGSAVSNHAAALLQGPFLQLGIAEMQDALYKKQLAGTFNRAARKILPTLASLIPGLSVDAADLTKVKRQPTGKAQKLIDEATMSDEEIETLNKLHAKDKNWVPRLKKADQEDVFHPHLKDEEGNPLIAGKGASTADLNLETGYVVSHRNSRTKVWVVKDWIRNESNQITDVVLERLASKWKKKETVERGGDKFQLLETERLVLAQTPDEKTVPLLQFWEWNNELEIPINASLFVRAGVGGRKKTTAKEIAGVLFGLGSQVPGWSRKLGDSDFLPIDAPMTMRQILKSLRTFKDGERALFTSAKLRNSGLLERQIGGKTPHYNWSSDVINHLEDLQSRYPNDYANLAAGADLPPPPPKSPGASTPWGPDDPRPGRGIIRDADKQPKFHIGTWSGLHLWEILKVPHAMLQPDRFSTSGIGTLKWLHSGAVKGEEVARKFLPFSEGGIKGLYWLLHNDHPTMEKYFRMLIAGQTWAPSKYGKTIWKLRSALTEATQYESIIGLINQNVKNVVGFEPGTGVARKLVVKGVNTSQESTIGGYNVGTHMNHPANLKYEQMLRWVQGVYKDPELGVAARNWTPEKVASTLKVWSYKDNISDINVWLGTPREHLDEFYDMTEAQWHAWDTYHQTHMQLLNMIEDTGVPLESIFPEHFINKMRVNFVPHLRTREYGFNAWDSPDPSISKFGAKPSQFREQVYEWTIEAKMREAAILDRIPHNMYEHDPVLALGRMTKSFYEYVAYDKFLDEFATHGIAGGDVDDVKMVADRLFRKDPNTGRPDLVRPSLLPEDAYGRSEGFRQKAAKYFGYDWETLIKSEDGRKQLSKQYEIYQDMHAAWNSRSLRSVVGIRGEDKGFVVVGDALRDIAIPPTATREIGALGGDILNKGNAFVSQMSAVANMMRLLATGVDFGVFLLHGAVSASTLVAPVGLLPKSTEKIPIAGKILKSAGMTTSTLPYSARFAWSKAVGHGMAALAFPSVRRQWYLNTIVERSEMQRYGVNFFRSTFLEDIPLPGLFSETYTGPLAKPTAKARAVAGGIAMRPIEGFGFFLDVAKTEMWRSYKNLGVLDGKTGTQLSDFAASINAIHGTLDPAIAGVKNKQRVFESAFLLYASMYRRSSVALLKNALSSKEMRRGPALAGISGLVAAGAAIGWAIKLSGHNDDVFKWGSPDFMAVKAPGGIRIGLGTPFYTMVRVASDLVGQMKDGELSGLKEPRFTDNTLLKGSRSQTSPVTSIFIDALNGRTFVGDPLRDSDGGWEVNNLGRRMTATIIPFWIDSLQDDTLVLLSSLVCGLVHEAHGAVFKQVSS